VRKRKQRAALRKSVRRGLLRCAALLAQHARSPLFDLFNFFFSIDWQFIIRKTERRAKPQC